jgi:hypothetical protein
VTDSALRGWNKEDLTPILLADSLGDRREELHRDWVDFFETNYRANGEIAHAREYLLVLGTRR